MNAFQIKNIILRTVVVFYLKDGIGSIYLITIDILFSNHQVGKIPMTELAHFTLGHTSDSETTKDVKEQEAETLTALICAEFGIDRKSEFYLKGWGTKNILAAMPKMSKAYAEVKKVLAA